MYKTLLALTLGATLTHAAFADEPAHKPYRVVVQVTDLTPDKLPLAITNGERLIQEFGKDTQVEVVVFGDAISLLSFSTADAPVLDSAFSHGIHVEACENSMKAHHLKKADMYPGVEFVPAGAGEIVRREAEGWQYLRP